MLILLVLLLLPFPKLSPLAHADALQSVRKFFQLPEEVEKIQDNYRMMQLQAEARYQQAQEDLDQAKETAEQFRLEQENIIRQNEQLTEENRQLAETVEGLRHTAELKEKTNKRLRTGIITAVLLLTAAFFISRFNRLALRRRY